MARKKKKRCVMCKRNKTLDNFRYTNRKKGYKQSYCKKCSNEYMRKYRKKYIPNYEGNFKVNKQILKEYKARKGCKICGTKEYLHFHHINPEEKEFTIGDGVGKAIVRLLLEIEKCEVLCASCHTMLHRKIAREKLGWTSN